MEGCDVRMATCGDLPAGGPVGDIQPFIREKEEYVFKGK